MRNSFRRLGCRMLQEGIAPQYVHRTITELCDHEADLVRESLTAGCTREQARSEARIRIGDDAVLLSEVLHRVELKCRFRHLAWLMYRFRVGVSVHPDWAPTDVSAYGADIFRWSLSACLSGLATVSLLFGLQMVVRF